MLTCRDAPGKLPPRRPGDQQQPNPAQPTPYAPAEALDLAELTTARLADPQAHRAACERAITSHEAALQEVRRRRHDLELRIQDLERRMAGSSISAHERLAERLADRTAACRRKWGALEHERQQHQQALEELW